MSTEKIDEQKMFEPEYDRSIANTPKDIPGWGMDADPDNNPTYPMKKYDGSDYERLNYQRPFQQPVNVEILHSNERPNITRVFGTSVPPSGISGAIRRFAFKYSESSYGHWVPLVFADRIDVIRAIISDLKKGIVPNLFAETGYTGEWKYNKKGVIKTAAVITGVIVFLIITTRLKARKSIADKN